MGVYLALVAPLIAVPLLFHCHVTVSEPLYAAVSSSPVNTLAVGLIVTTPFKSGVSFLHEAKITVAVRQAIATFLKFNLLVVIFEKFNPIPIRR